MIPAARGTAVAYSAMLQASGLPMEEAHDAFETSLTATGESRELTVEEKRAQLQAHMAAAGTDATARAMAGTLR